MLNQVYTSIQQCFGCEIDMYRLLKDSRTIPDFSWSKLVFLNSSLNIYFVVTLGTAVGVTSEVTPIHFYAFSSL